MRNGTLGSFTVGRGETLKNRRPLLLRPTVPTYLGCGQGRIARRNAQELSLPRRQVRAVIGRGQGGGVPVEPHACERERAERNKNRDDEEEAARQVARREERGKAVPRGPRRAAERCQHGRHGGGGPRRLSGGGGGSKRSRVRIRRRRGSVLLLLFLL